jgi:rod shape determining protein RodA
MPELTRLGWGLAIPVLFLCGLGLAAIHAAERGATFGRTDERYRRTDSAAEPADLENAARGWRERLSQTVGPLTRRQLAYLAGGVALMLAILQPAYQKIGRYVYPAYFITLGLLVLLVLDRYVDLPMVPVRKDVRRWVSLGPLSLQPSEFMKLVLVLTLARYLRFRDSYRRLQGLIVPFLLTLIPMALILAEPDLGTTLMLPPVLFLMLFVAGARLRHLTLLALLGAALLPALYLWGMKEYQRDRIRIVFRQDSPDERWHAGPGYQLRQSKIALGSGGLYGHGWGRGVFIESPTSLLPEEHNDFIFALIGHQWGFIGCLLVILAYAAIVLFGLEVATITNDPFGRLIALGVVTMIVVQALLNMAMTAGLAPVTGMTLPFVSAGGSSLWANFLGLGLLVNVARRRPMLIAHPPFEHED